MALSLLTLDKIIFGSLPLPRSNYPARCASISSTSITIACDILKQIEPLLRNAALNIIQCSRKLRGQLDGTLYRQDAPNGLSVLWATARGDAAALRKAVRHGAPVDAQWPRKWRSPWKESCPAKWLAFKHKVKGYTALQIASVLGHTHLIETLIGAGANANAVTVCCWSCEAEEETNAFHDITPRAARKTSLHLAICHRNWSTAEAIIRHGSSLTVDGPDGPEDVVSWIDNNGPNIHNLSALHDLSRHWTPGDGACDFAGWLVTHGGIEVNAPTDQGMTPLATACAAGQFKLAHRLLSLGANCNDRVPTRPTETLIHIALRACNDMGMRRLAVNTGGDEYSIYLSGREEALDMVPELIRLLIAEGVAVDATDANKQTPLRVAATFGELGVIELLLRSGANPEMQDVFGATPLDLAKKQSPLVTAARWSRRPGCGPSPSPTTSDDIGFATDQTGRVVFELSEIHTPHTTSTLRQQCWVVIDGQDPILEHVPHISSTYRGGNPLLVFALSGISAVFWAAKGRPRVILKLKTYDYHVKALRKHIARVEFRDNHNKACFLRFVLPFVLTMEEKSRASLRKTFVLYVLKNI
ncbi:putative ankyrin repeat protein RF_0381 [Colletotrichum liriopes]|uniref:Ankyrin repeat protein RF_0381 n=1 Tax=Colletotrichum liriopes TaxID=708192 RepID=A0AA37GYS6_9PEZI|nr:putative ankyrin repeat protein RF_0381 [Colletotrichum liriopes]